MSLDFVQRYFVLTADLVADGVDWTYLRHGSAIRFAERLLDEGDDRTPVLELAGMVSPIDRLDVEKLVSTLRTAEPGSTRAKWLKVMCWWIYENNQHLDDGFEQIGLVCADFGYPEDLSRVWLGYSSGTQAFWEEVRAMLERSGPGGNVPDNDR